MLIRSMPPSEPEVACVLPPGAFRVVWGILVTLYSIVTLYLLAHTAMYAVFYVFPITAYYTSTFQLLQVRAYPVVSAAYAATALVYVQQLFKIVTRSVQYRQLSFAFSSSPTNEQVIGPSRLDSATTRAGRLYASLFGSTGVLGVRGPYFGVMTLLRETVEISVQIHQAYQSSRYTAGLWINLTFGGLIIANCLSTPILHWWFDVSRHKEGRLRLLVLCVDLALDLVWLLVLPVLFWLPYYQALRGNEAVPFDDTFMPKALMELRFIFATSFADLVFAKLLPAWSVFFTLRKMQNLVRMKQKTRRPAVMKIKASHHPGCASVTPLTLLTPVPVLSSKQAEVHRFKGLEKLLTKVLLVSGLCAIVVYFVAYVVYKPQCLRGCQVVLRPWFEIASTHCFCAVQEINCHAHGIQGTADELTLVLLRMEARGLLSLILTHCNDLGIPPAITRFRDLYRVELFNCSISSWGAAAALTAASFPQLGIVSLISTGIVEIPPGLLQGDLPPTLLEVQIVDSKLSTLPDNLGDLWPYVSTLFLERAAFTEYPGALQKMPHLQSLTLYMNNISSIDTDAFEANRFAYLLLSANPLRELPFSLRKSTSLTELQIMNTHIPTVAQATQWAGDGADRSDDTIIFGLGSPFCEQASTDPLPKRIIVDCTPKWKTLNGERSFSWYPFEGKAKQRQLHPL